MTKSVSPCGHALVLTSLLTAACGGPPVTPERQASPSEVNRDAGRTQSARWDLQSSGEGVALVHFAGDRTTAIRLFCPAGTDQLLVSVPEFRPIGSEERMSIASNDLAVALVADSRGDPARGGVTATGPVPDEIKAIAQGPVSASYGAQTSGPHPIVPDELARRFVVACHDHVSAAREAAARPNASTNPCLVQDGELLRMSPLKVVGTEPFWAARIEGRCVTYMTPDDQKGTRLWTRVGSGPTGPIFDGAFQGKPFVLALHLAAPPGCSDGMSDRRYDWAAALTVSGERRRGCGETITTGR